MKTKPQAASVTTSVPVEQNIAVLGTAHLYAVPPERDTVSCSHDDRELRGQKLAHLFIGEMIPLFVQVRQDFLDKEGAETICGVRTFTEYCTEVLGYSEGYIRHLIKGQNPATKLHDGSANRKPPIPPAGEPVPYEPEPEPEPEPKPPTPAYIQECNEFAQNLFNSDVHVYDSKSIPNRGLIYATFDALEPEDFKAMTLAGFESRRQRDRRAA